MKIRKHKFHDARKDERFNVYSSIHETKEKGKLRFVLRLLKRLKKGH